jgi:hypothetical protein
VDLFSNNLQLRLGRCDIIINHKLGDHISALASLVDPFLGKILQSMFITQPPCKALSIYMLSYSYLVLELVKRVRDADGIRIGHLLGELQQNLPRVIDLWRTRSQAMRLETAQQPWKQLSSPMNKHWCWNTGFPKLVMFLESADHNGETFVLATFLQTEDHGRMWEEE